MAETKDWPEEALYETNIGDADFEWLEGSDIAEVAVTNLGVVLIGKFDLDGARSPFPWEPTDRHNDFQIYEFLSTSQEELPDELWDDDMYTGPVFEGAISEEVIILSDEWELFVEAGSDPDERLADEDPVMLAHEAVESFPFRYAREGGIRYEGHEWTGVGRRVVEVGIDTEINYHFSEEEEARAAREDIEALIDLLRLESSQSQLFGSVVRVSGIEPFATQQDCPTGVSMTIPIGYGTQLVANCPENDLPNG